MPSVSAGDFRPIRLLKGLDHQQCLRGPGGSGYPLRMAFATAWACGFLPATVLKLLSNQEGSASFHDHGNALVPCMGWPERSAQGTYQRFQQDFRDKAPNLRNVIGIS